MKRFNTYFEIKFGKISKFLGKRWDLFLENGTKWEVEGGLGEYGCKRRPDESVQIIGSTYIYIIWKTHFYPIWKYIFPNWQKFLSNLEIYLF